MRSIWGKIGSLAILAIAGLLLFKFSISKNASSTARHEAETEMKKLSLSLQQSPERSRYVLTASDLRTLQVQGLLTKGSEESLRPLVKN